jgi:hypothetical protein
MTFIFKNAGSKFDNIGRYMQNCHIQNILTLLDHQKNIIKLRHNKIELEMKLRL